MVVRESRRRAAGAVTAALLVVLSAACRSSAPDSGQAARDRREAAYRANNRGVGLLEQFAYDRAVGAFQEALQIDPAVRLARVNLAIALFYAGRIDEAAASARMAQEDYPDAPEPAYLLGLIARVRNQPEEATRQFERVLRVDVNDAGARTNLAMGLLDRRRYGEAVAMAESALAVEPYNVTAAYTRGLALTRLGHPDAARAMQQFDRLRTAPYAITYSQSYLGQGRYAEAVASSGAEPELVSTAAPPVTFADVTTEWLPQGAQPQAGTAGAVALVDLDSDGDLDLLAGGAMLRLLRNDRPRFTDETAMRLAAPVAEVRGIVGGDLTGDARADLLVLTAAGPRLLIQAADGRFTPVPLPGSAAREDARAAALTDVDHDGDLDLFLGGAAGRLLRNNGNGSFTDVTAAAGLRSAAAGVAVVPTDFDNRRDIDLVTVTRGSRVMVFRNLRTGAFEDVGATVGAPGAADYAALAAGDVNKDGFTDLFLGREATAAVWALSERSGRYRETEAPAATRGTRAAQLVDYDNDGLLDLLAITTDGPRLLRNAAGQWQEHAGAVASAVAVLPSPLAVTALAAGDLDLDGDTDVAVAVGGGAVRIWRNDGGNRNRAVQVALTGRVSNRAGVGAKVELRAGSLYQRMETAVATPPVVPADVTLGLGSRASADAIRVLWPSGVLQAELPAAPAAADVTRVGLTELDRKPSSCPYLYTWNGERFEFVTDFLGGGEMGYLHTPPDGRTSPDPDEYIRITDRQLRERGHRLDLRVTNELEEVLFMDHLALGVIEHPADTDVFPDEGMRQRLRPFQTYTVRAAQPPAAAHDEHGHDVLARIARRDRHVVDDFALAAVRGYAAEHVLVVDLPQPPRRSATERDVLLLTGWTDYAFSSDNVRAHQAGLTLVPPLLQVETPSGAWQTVDADVGVPVGRPQTLVLDVTRYVPRRVRLVTSMRIYWDEVLVGTAVRQTPTLMAAPLRTAELRWRGFSQPVTMGGHPLSYDYQAVSRTTPWKLMPGRYTREGDVLELLAAADDRFVIARPGDELALSFDAAGLPPLGPGMRRTYVLYTVGFSKEMDLHSASPDVVEPIPFRRMTTYPFVWPERYPHEEDLARFHTRVVPRAIGTLLPETLP